MPDKMTKCNSHLAMDLKLRVDTNVVGPMENKTPIKHLLDSCDNNTISK